MGATDPGLIDEVGVIPEAPRLLSGITFRDNRRIVVAIAIVVLIVIFCFAGPLVYSRSVHVNLADVNLPPGGPHPLGTDVYGRDVLSQLMVGGRASLELSFAVAIASTAIGTVYGAIAGLAGGKLDGLMMRIIDVILAVPTFILLIIAATLYTLNLGTIILVLSVLSWPGVARLVRGQVLVLRRTDFMDAARISGARPRWLLVRHILPNTLNVVIPTATFAVADSIYALSALSFLGLGPQPPFSDWGTMLTQGVNNLFDGYWWEVYPPLIALVITVLVFRQIGDAVGDVARGRGRRR